MKFIKVAAILSLAATAGCASRADGVAPVAVPAANYVGMTCQDTNTMLTQKRAEENTLRRKQNNAATGDAVGVFLFLIPVSSVFGGDKEGELAQTKGEVIALESAVRQNCNGRSPYAPAAASQPATAPAMQDTQGYEVQKGGALVQ